MSDRQFAMCPLCGFPLQSHQPPDKNRVYRLSCNVCGTFRITDMLLASDILTDNVKLLLSGITRRRFDLGQPATITIDNWQALASQAPAKNDVPNKVRCLLGYIAHKSDFPGETVTLTGLLDYPICFAANEKEFIFYLQDAVNAGFIEEPMSGVRGEHCVCLTPKGWQEASRTPTLDSPYAFVAMAFAKEGNLGALLTNAFEQAIRPAVEEDAGYEKAIRIDKEEFLGDIVFEIIARIKECRFVIADVTDHRNGVYFEAGYAMGMGLPVIWLCHKDHMEKAHFDTSHLNHIVWDSISELRTNLANRILATIGRGPQEKERRLAESGPVTGRPSTNRPLDGGWGVRLALSYSSQKDDGLE